MNVDMIMAAFHDNSIAIVVVVRRGARMHLDVVIIALYDYRVVIAVVVAVVVATVRRARMEVDAVVVSRHDDLIVIAMVVMMG